MSSAVLGSQTGIVLAGKDHVRRRIVVTGTVQGVFYRAWLIEQAQALGVAGWVRNRTDGSVEAVVQGLAGQVEVLVALARQGSPASRVADVTITADLGEEALTGFTKRPTL